MKPVNISPFLLLFMPAMAVAESIGHATLYPDYMARFVVGLGLVLAIFISLAWLFRRLNGGRLGGHGPVRMLGGVPVGQRERVVLVEVGDCQMLIGVAPGYIRTLHVLDSPVQNEDQQSNGSGDHTTNMFRLRSKYKD